MFDVADARPHMTIAVREDPPGQGVVVGDVDLRSVLDAIDRAQVGTQGYAYAVDAAGVLIAHPDSNLVLQHTSFASLPQVQAALTGDPATTADVVTNGRDSHGIEVLSAFQRSIRLAGGSSLRNLQARRLPRLRPQFGERRRC